MELVQAAQQAGIRFRAVVADCVYGDNPGFTDALGAARVPFVLALKPRKGTWAPADAAHTPDEAARELGWRGPTRPGRWRRVIRVASATATPRPGGRPTPSSAAGARTGGCGWWWPPPTRPACPGTAPGIC